MNLFFRLLYLFSYFRWRRRRLARQSALEEAITPFRVWPTDLDVNRHMTNGKYLSIMDLGRVDLMLRSGLFDVLRREKIYPVVASQSIRYRRSLTAFERFGVRTRVLGWDDRFIFLQQTFERKGETVASAVVKGIFLRKSGGRVLPSEVVELSGITEPTPDLPEWVRQWTQSEDQAWEASAL